VREKRRTKKPKKLLNTITTKKKWEKTKQIQVVAEKEERQGVN